MALAPLTVLIGVLSACVLAALSPFVRRRAGLVAVAAAAAMLVLAALTLAREAHGLPVWFGAWTPRDGVALGVAFTVDGLGAGLATFVAALGVVAAVLASRLIAEEQTAFDAVGLLFIAAMLGFCLTGDLFNLFVFFELMSVAAYVLVGYEVRQRTALEGALTFAVTNSVGSILLLFGIALVYGRTGALNLAAIGRAFAAGPHDTLVVVSFALIAAGLLVKAAIVPFHLWTADAYAVAPTPVCVLLAGAFSELGLYGLARVYWTAFEPALSAHAPELRAILVAAGLLTGLLGAVMCAAQQHLKRMLAFATIAQVGLFLVGIGLLSPGGVAGAAIWIVGDGLVKAALFTAIAIVQHRYGTVETGELHGRGRSIWPLGLLVVLCALMVASLPGTGSFLGKAMVEDAALAAGGYDWVPGVMLVVTALVAGALLRAAAQVFWGLGPPPESGETSEGDAPDREDRSSRVLWVCAGVLVAAAVAWGDLPGLVDAAGRAAAAFVDQPAYAAAVLDGRATVHAVPGEVHGPGATAYLYAVGSLLAAVGFAALGLFRRLPRGAAIDALRRLHSGRPGDYVAWTAIGAALLGGLFVLTLQ